MRDFQADLTTVVFNYSTLPCMCMASGQISTYGGRVGAKTRSNAPHLFNSYIAWEKGSGVILTLPILLYIAVYLMV